jgi:hypothetical protein
VRSFTVGFEDGDVVEIPVELIVIEPEADDETVGDLETAIFYRHLHDAP